MQYVADIENINSCDSHCDDDYNMKRTDSCKTNEDNNSNAESYRLKICM